MHAHRLGGRGLRQGRRPVGWLPGIRAELEGLLENWRDLLAEHAVKTRQILQKLRTKRIRFVPEARDGRRGYRLEAEGTVRPLLTGVVLASPTGDLDMYLELALAGVTRRAA